MYDLLEFYTLIGGIVLVISGWIQRDANAAETHIKVCTVILGLCGIGLFCASKFNWL